MENRDKVFAQNWIEQLREGFRMHPFLHYVGQPLTHVYEAHPDVLVNCFWWDLGTEWGCRDIELELNELVR